MAAVTVLSVAVRVEAEIIDSRGSTVNTLRKGAYDYVACAGVDTVISDTFRQAGNPYHGVTIWGAGDSVNVIVDILTSDARNKADMDSAKFCVGYDRAGSQAWATVATWTLVGYTEGTREKHSIAMPPSEWFCYRVRNATASANGANTKIYGRIRVSP